MAELRKVPGGAPAEDVVRLLREDGGVIIEDLIDARTIEAINAEVTPTSTPPIRRCAT